MNAFTMQPLFLATSLQLVGNQAISTVTMNDSTYRTATTQGQLIERAINDAQYVVGLTPENDKQLVIENIADKEIRYYIARSRFEQLLNGRSI